MAFANVPTAIGLVVASQLATLHELSTVYGVEDLHDFLEVIVVERYNRTLASKQD